MSGGSPSESSARSSLEPHRDSRSLGKRPRLAHASPRYSQQRGPEPSDGPCFETPPSPLHQDCRTGIAGTRAGGRSLFRPGRRRVRGPEAACQVPAYHRALRRSYPPERCKSVAGSSLRIGEVAGSRKSAFHPFQLPPRPKPGRVLRHAAIGQGSGRAASVSARSMANSRQGASALRPSLQRRRVTPVGRKPNFASTRPDAGLSRK